MIAPCLLVMNPRRIPRCMAAIDALKIDKLYMQNMWERQLEPVIADVVENSLYRHTHYILLSDDTVPTQEALDKVVLGLYTRPVVTGYCNLDAKQPYVNLTKRPFDTRLGSCKEAYDWFTRKKVDTWPEPFVPTYFAGACLTGMSRELWRRFPFRVLGENDCGFASDWMLSVRLHTAGIPIVAARGAFIEHLKPDWLRVDRTPEHALLNGREPAGVRWSFKDGPATVAPERDVRDMPSGQIAHDGDEASDPRMTGEGF